AAQDAAFCLAPQSQQNKIMARKQGVDDLRNHGVFVTVHAGEKRFTVLDGAQQILTNLVFHGARSAARVEIRNAFKLAKSAWLGMCRGELRSRGCRHGSRSARQMRRRATCKFSESTP